jgi:hypothetical protein
VPRTALVRVEYDDAARARAVQVAQEEATVLEAIVASRLGAATRASIADPARAARLGRPVGRDVLVGSAVGLALGLAAAALLGRGRREVVKTAVPVESHVDEPGVVEEPAPIAPEPAAVATPEPEPPRPGRVAELRALVAERGAEFSADQIAEWNGYLDALAGQEVDGELPPNLTGLVEDVFAPLLQRP